MADYFGKVCCALHTWGEATRDPKGFDDLPSIVQRSVRQTLNRDYVTALIKSMEDDLENAEIPLEPKIDIAITKVYQEGDFMSVEYQY